MLILWLNVEKLTTDGNSPKAGLNKSGPEMNLVFHVSELNNIEHQLAS